MRSRVIYCQDWYSRTDNVHWCRSKRATAGVVGISQNEVGLRRRSQESEGPRRQNRDYDLSNRFDGRLDLLAKDGFAATRRVRVWGSTKRSRNSTEVQPTHGKTTYGRVG